MTTIEKLYDQLGPDKVKSLWAFHTQKQRTRKSGGRNGGGGKKPICGNCRSPDCRSCKRRGLI